MAQQKMDQVFIDMAKENLAANRTEDVLDDLLDFFKPIDRKFYNNLIGLKGQYSRLEEKKNTFQITEDKYDVRLNQLNQAIIFQIDRFYDRNSKNKKDKPFEAAPTGVSMREDEDHDLTMEVVLGNRDLNKVNWLSKGLWASKSICFVERADGITGTGFLVKGGLLMTNNHVLENIDHAKGAKIKFDYEEDVEGQSKKTAIYTLDPDAHFQTDPNLDYTLVKVSEAGAEVPLSNWGSLKLGNAETVAEGEFVTIIQHPQGRTKEISFDRISSITDHVVKYRADTEGGSSGSPVFDVSWNVVALHHGGAKSFNQGTRMDVILEHLDGVNLA